MMVSTPFIYLHTLFLLMYAFRCLIGFTFLLWGLGAPYSCETVGLVPAGSLKLGASCTHMNSCELRFFITL